jgi:hypothetical protein
MRSMRVLAVLHPGAMGAAVAACLVGRGHKVGWLRLTSAPPASGKFADPVGCWAAWRVRLLPAGATRHFPKRPDQPSHEAHRIGVVVLRTRVVVADDDVSLSAGLKSLLDRSGFKVVRQAANAHR